MSFQEVPARVGEKEMSGWKEVKNKRSVLSSKDGVVTGILLHSWAWTVGLDFMQQK